MKFYTRTLATLTFALLWASQANAFCGFYVAKADTKLFNKASKVVLVRDEQRTVVTMANDFQGDVKEFAIVVPVPTVLQKEQIHIGNQANIDHLDAYSAPRLVEYFDPDPCAKPDVVYETLGSAVSAPQPKMEFAKKNRSLGVTIEAEYTVGEYDILILSATQSSGLATWLKQNHYKIPAGAEAVLDSYIKQDLKFFVAKVNLKEHAKLGFNYLRPLQMAFDSSKFMLPIRLGTVNADGPQELFVFALTRKGRVETTNYRTVKLPSNTEVPVYVKDEFPRFYQAMFTQQLQKQNNSVVFLEYAWDMNWCDPCAADPLSDTELRELGVFWINDPKSKGFKSQARDVYITRLHLRYTAETFPDDLRFQTTGDRSNFQGRYVITHPWKGDASRCQAAKNYLEQLQQRQQQRVENLARLTGWDITTIRSKTHWPQSITEENKVHWWQKLWN